MKRIFLTLSVVILFSINNQAQNHSNSSNSCLSEHNYLVDLTYGFPNWSRIWLGPRVVDNGIGPSSVYKNIGPIDLKVEKMISSKIGIGAEILYTDMSVKFSETETDSVGNINFYSVEVGRKHFSIMPSFNYHFFIDSKFEMHMSVAAGYKHVKWFARAESPNYEDEVSVGSVLPIDFRSSIGMHYYFSEIIGMKLDFGLGGPLVSAGLSFRL